MRVIIPRLMADTPRAFDAVPRMLERNHASSSGPRTPWSPVRSGPGRVATAPLLDLEDYEAELPVVGKRGSGATIPRSYTTVFVDLRCLLTSCYSSILSEAAAFYSAVGPTVVQQAS